MVIKNARVLCSDFVFRNLDIRIEQDKIAEIAENLTDAQVLDGTGKMALPGFVDIHTHGCVGYDTCDANLYGYEKMCLFYASKGVTSFLFTSMTLSKENLSEIFQKIDTFCKQEHHGATALGIYFEGPFISREKKGAQSGEFITQPYMETLMHLDQASGNRIKVVALAPEVAGAMEFIDQAKHDYTITLAHTAANYDIAAEAARRGVKMVTHLYNGMVVPSHREPAVPGAAFDHGLYTEIICDGIHLHPSVVRTTFKAAGQDRVVLISDSMQAAGMPDGTYALGGQDVFVSNGKATLANGTIAGSSTNLHQAFKNVVNWGIPIEAAAKAASINPARAIGMDAFVGSLAQGKWADILLMDTDLAITDVFVRGKHQ